MKEELSLSTLCRVWAGARTKKTVQVLQQHRLGSISYGERLSGVTKTSSTSRSDYCRQAPTIYKHCSGDQVLPERRFVYPGLTPCLYPACGYRNGLCRLLYYSSRLRRTGRRQSLEIESGGSQILLTGSFCDCTPCLSQLASSRCGPLPAQRLYP
jgi:hypothetical protein